MDRQAQVIRERNERSREALASDLQALGDKLDVKQQVTRKKTDMVDNIKGRLGMDTTHHNGNGTGDQHAHSEVGAILEAVRSHPVATAALTLGTRTLVKSWRESHSHLHEGTTPVGTVGRPMGSMPAGGSEDQGGGIKDTIGERASSVKDAASDVAHKATDVAGSLTGHAKDLGGTVKGSVGDGTSAVSARVGDVRQKAAATLPTSMPELESTVRSNLPIFGIGALAAGAIFGLLAPRTKLEDERLGELHTTIVDTVQDKAMEAKDAVQHSMQDALGEAKVVAQDALGDAKVVVKDAVQSTKDELSGGEDSGDEQSVEPLKRPGMITGSGGIGGSALTGSEETSSLQI